MSASSKKKLRNAENLEKLTEKQLAEQKEAKKLKILTTVFVVVLAVMIVAAVYAAITKTFLNSNTILRKTTAVTIGEHKLSSAELSYFFVDAVSQFYNESGPYAAMIGLDISKPLDKQIADEATGRTWADYFVDNAVANAASIYALADEAKQQGYELTEEDNTNITNTMGNASLYAMYGGYSSVDGYLKYMYGNGADRDSFKAYIELNTLASSYHAHYAETLEYDDAALKAESDANETTYNAYSYNTYYMTTSKFLQGGTTDENGTTTYSDEEKAAAVKAAEEAAASLVNLDSIEDLDKAIAALDVNKDVENAASSSCVDYAYSSISTTIRDWVVDTARKAGDSTYIASETTTTDENGTETTTVNGYYVVYFNECNDNTFPLINVRHILVAFEGGTADANGNKTYSDAEKKAAQETAEELYKQWKDGEKTEDSFAELANEKSADGDGTTGGLYEDVYPGQMVTNFNDWCFDDTRKPGDTGIVESPYGYHIMYFVGNSEDTYRNFLIRNALVSKDTTAWYDALVDAMEISKINAKRLPLGMIMSSGTAF